MKDNLVTISPETLKQNSTRWMERGRRDLETLPLPEELRTLIRESLEVPQLGPYHNEGPLMAAHYGLILESIDTIVNGQFDFSQLELPQNQIDAVREYISSAVRKHKESMNVYVYLHDIEKKSAMNIEDASKKQRPFSMEEWRELVQKHGGNAEAALQELKDGGAKKIGYRIGKELAKEYAIEKREHGEHGEQAIRELLSGREGGEEFLTRYEVLFKGVANHELHFQVFNSARSPSQYKKQLADKFSPEEIDFIYAACFIDIAGSLDIHGRADFSSFRNMIIARESFRLIQESGLANTSSLMNLGSVEEVVVGIEKLRREEMVKQVILSDTDITTLQEHIGKWGLASPEDAMLVQQALSELANIENPTKRFAELLPNQLKRYSKNLKEYLETKI